MVCQGFESLWRTKMVVDLDFNYNSMEVFQMFHGSVTGMLT